MGDKVNRADPFMVEQRDDLPELSAEEREGLIRVGAAGGRIRNRDLPTAVGLLDLRLVIPYRPGMVQLSENGIRALAAMAKRATGDA